MSEDIKTILKCLTLFVVGFIANYAMTWLAAPDYSGTALAVGVFLTAFGLGFAIFSMQMVMLPLGIIKIVWQLARGEKPFKRGEQKGDHLDTLGRILFVFLYAMFSTATGMYVGYLTGGMGLLSTAAMFAVAGVLLPLLAPLNLIWGEGDSNGGYGMDAAQRADMDEARKNGDPSALFVDKVAKRVIGALVEAPTTNDKSNNR